MVLQDALPLKQSVWHVTRRFEGEKSPEDLLRALIQAHKPKFYIIPQERRWGGHGNLEYGGLSASLP